MTINKAARLESTRDRRTYKKAAIEITSIEFVPMSERERQQAIAILAQLFASVLHEPELQQSDPKHG